MNYGDIVRFVSEEVSYDPYLVGDPQTLLDYANRALEKMRSYSPDTDDEVTFSSVIGQQEYNLPDDLVKVNFVLYDGEPLDIFPYAEAKKQESLYFTGVTDVDGYPGMCYIRNMTNSNEVTVPGQDPKGSGIISSRYILGFQPVPAIDTDIVVSYSKNIPLFTGTDNSEIPAIPNLYHEAICMYMLMRLNKKRNEHQIAQTYEAEWTKALNKFSVFQKNLHPTYMSVTNSDNY
jgi:hypothetical protein